MHLDMVAEMHPITPEEVQHIKANGHEISSYVFETENKRIRPEWFKRQSDSFLKRFGARPITVVLDVLRWKGWAEPRGWMAECGIKADNSFSGSVTDNALIRSDDEARHPLN